MAVWWPGAQKLGLFPSAHAIAMGDKEYHGAVNIGATMKARYNAWQQGEHWCRASTGARRAASCALRSSSLGCAQRARARLSGVGACSECAGCDRVHGFLRTYSNVHGAQGW